MVVKTTSINTPVKSPGGWRTKVDLDAFKADIDAIGKTLKANQGQADYDHLQKMLLWQRSCFYGGLFISAFVGYAKYHNLINNTILLTLISIIGIFLLSTGINTRWTMVAHHVCHGGYDSLKIMPYNR